jgi:hypothetical protein
MGPSGAQKRAKGVTFNDFHFFDEESLRPLLEKERGIKRTVGPPLPFADQRRRSVDLSAWAFSRTRRWTR